MNIPEKNAQLEKIARMLSELHIALSLATGQKIIRYPARTQNVILRLQEHCLANIRIPDLETDHVATETKRKG